MIPKVEACLETLDKECARFTSSTAGCGIRCCLEIYTNKASARKWCEKRMPNDRAQSKNDEAKSKDSKHRQESPRDHSSFVLVIP